MTTNPFPLEDPVLQRLFEDIYQKVRAGELTRDQGLKDLQEQLAVLRDRLATEEKGPLTPSLGKVLPVPDNLTISKIGFFGLASVTPYRFKDYQGLQGYEFYGSVTEDFTPNDDRESENFNRLSHGPMPWSAFWCGLEDVAYYVVARTYGTNGYSAFTSIVSSEDLPPTPTAVTARQQGNLYPRLGQLMGKVIVEWDHMENEHIVGYDVETIDEGEY